MWVSQLPTNKYNLKFMYHSRWLQRRLRDTIEKYDSVTCSQKDKNHLWTFTYANNNASLGNGVTSADEKDFPLAYAQRKEFEFYAAKKMPCANIFW